MKGRLFVSIRVHSWFRTKPLLQRLRLIRFEPAHHSGNLEKCTSPDKTDTEIWLTNAVCYRSECCTAFKVASRHKRHLPTGYPPFIPFALLNYVMHSEKGWLTLF